MNAPFALVPHPRAKEPFDASTPLFHNLWLNTQQCKKISARFVEWVAELLCHSAILGSAAEHFEGDSQNLGGMFYTTL